MNLKAYLEAKQRHPDMLLIARVGDFYELYGDDAEAAARLLGLSLTTRVDRGTGAKVLMAGFPHHALESHLRALVQAGRRVAICEQVEDPGLDAVPHKVQSTLFDELEEY